MAQGASPPHDHADLRFYERHREAQSFLNDPDGAILLASRQSLADILPKLRASAYAKALLICE